MGIGPLPDKGRITRRLPDEELGDVVEVDGEKVMVSQEVETGEPMPWFRGRMYSKQTTEAQADGRRAQTTRYKFKYKRKHDVRKGDELEIESKQLGNAHYTVDGLPTPIRKRRTVIGWTVSVVEAE